MVQIKRAYDPISKADGKRFLVDRLWPRGIKKADLHLADWVKEAAPSNQLRKWFNHDPAKWDEFQKRYRIELKSQPEALASLLKSAKEGNVTLLFGARENDHNNAVVLRDYLNEHWRLKITAKQNKNSQDVATIIRDSKK